MNQKFVRFRRRHKHVCAAALMIFGLLLILICVPYWALVAILGFTLIGGGAYCMCAR